MTFKHKLARRLALLKDRRLVALVAVLAAATVFSCEQPLPITDPTVAVDRVVVSPEAVTLQLNQSADFTAVSLTASGDTSPVGVVWSATGGVISDTGTTGRRHHGRYKNGSCGTYKLIARNSPGWKADTANIAVACVTPVMSVNVTPASATIQTGQTVQLTATPMDSTGTPVSGQTVAWASSNPAVATVSSGGLVAGSAAGSAMMTATSGGQSGTAAITVTTVPVGSVDVTPVSASVQVGKTVQLAAMPKDASGNPLSGRVVTWASTNAAVATVSSSGLVSGVAAGSVTIVGTSEGTSGTSAITVTAVSVPVASVTVSPASASVPAGQTVQLTATPKDANGNALSGRAVTWTSNNTALATVNSSGLVSGVAAGSATITATSEGQNGTSAITVTAPPPPAPVASVTVSPASASVPAGQTVQLTATLKDANGNALSGRAVTWTSNTTPVATVNSSGLVSGVTAGSATITATSEGQSGTSAITVTAPPPPAPVASVTVSPASASVPASQTVQLAATLKDANGNPLSGRVVTWSSNNTGVASVNSSGLVSGVAVGSATITATSEGQNGTSAITVTPVPVASVAVTPASASIQVGQTAQLTATPKDANGNALTGRVVTWSSSNTTVATVSASGLVTGKVAGSATITATSEGQSGSSAITVTPVPVASVTVSPASTSIQVGQTVQLTATPKDANGNPLTGRTVTWSSNNTSVATVSSSGLVTGKAAGSAMITATSEGQSGTSAITVTQVPVASVAVSPASASVQVGQAVQLTATPKDASGNPLSGRVVSWSSSNTTVATVSSGLVTGKVAGSATITATSEGQSGTSAITVTALPPPSTSVVFVGAGDIADCGNTTDEATANLLDNIAGTVFTVGDNAYPSGSASDYQCYDASWGRHKARTRPSPGNHDYNTSGASGYYNYFGANAGPSGRGYYSYDIGDWHIVSLNSNVDMSAGSAQEQWLRADLAASTKSCTIAHWHHPRFSSGPHGSDNMSQDIWQALYDAGADIVISGHDHDYERFAPQTPSGQADPVRGIREFVVGTGGESHYGISTPIANSEAHNDDTFGVLKLTLSAGSYSWQFVPVAGGTYKDSGSGSCH